MPAAPGERRKVIADHQSRKRDGKINRRGRRGRAEDRIFPPRALCGFNND